MLRDRPPFTAPLFDGTPEPVTFHAGLPQEEALARLEWLCGNRERCGIVVGDPGVGKSHLVAVAARRLAGLGAEVAVLSVGGLPEGEWLELLLDRLPLDQRSRAESIRPWQKLENRLRQNALLERTTALVFDDVDRAPADALAGIARLVAAVEPRFGSVLGIVDAATIERAWRELMPAEQPVAGTDAEPGAADRPPTVRVVRRLWG
jgi:type II secretory pathway predicted ATPase ExeA